MSENPPSYISHDVSDGIGRLSPHDVAIRSILIDVSALVKLTQTFRDIPRVPLYNARYAFTVPDKASVCAFELKTTSGYTVTGQVRGKHRNTKPAAEVGTQVTNRVFTIALGDIAQTECVTYVINLLDTDFVDHIRFCIPRSVAYYIEYPHTIPPDQATSAITNPTLKIRLDIRTSQVVQSIGSASHPELSITPHTAANGVPSHTRVHASFTSTTPLTRDFVVKVHAEGLRYSRCFAQADSQLQSVTMHLTLIPDLHLPRIESQEYIFLLDRSGSMSGSRIKTAKTTLVSLLQTLPAQGTLFNIFSFGSTWSSLHPQSQPYNQQSLNDSKAAIEGMDADMGGTQLFPALDQIFSTREKGHPTAVFVLTDGEVFDIHDTTNLVTREVAYADPSAPLRVFMLGIGKEASLKDCEGIAKAGNGLSLMATNATDILPEFVKLVEASRTYILKNVTIDWGIRRQPHDDSPYLICQVPALIGAIYSGRPFVANAMITARNYVIPKEVVVQGQRDGKGKTIRFRVPVVHIDDEDEGTVPIIGTLAAQRYIDSVGATKGITSPNKPNATAVIRLGERYQLESRYTSFVPIARISLPPKPIISRRKGTSEGLVTRLASLYKRKSSSPPRVEGPVRQFENAPPTATPGIELDADPVEAPDDQDKPRPSVGLEMESPTPISSDKVAPVAGPSNHMKVASSRTRPHSSQFLVHTDPPQAHYFPEIPQLTQGEIIPSIPSVSESAVEETVKIKRLRSGVEVPPTPPPKIEGLVPVGRLSSDTTDRAPAQTRCKSPWWKWKPCPMFPPASKSSAPRGQVLTTWLPHFPVVVMYDSNMAPPERSGKSQDENQEEDSDEIYEIVMEPAPIIKDSRIQELVELQGYDGSFDPGPLFVEILGEDMVRLGESMDTSDVAWATALAVIYMQRYWEERPELLKRYVEKAMDAGQRRCKTGVSFENLLQEARKQRL